MSLFGLKFSQMILHTETSKLMYNWSFLFVVLHKPTLLPSTFNAGLHDSWIWFSSTKKEKEKNKVVLSIFHKTMHYKLIKISFMNVSGLVAFAVISLAKVRSSLCIK